VLGEVLEDGVGELGGGIERIEDAVGIVFLFLGIVVNAGVVVGIYAVDGDAFTACLTCVGFGLEQTTFCRLFVRLPHLRRVWTWSMVSVS